MAKPSKKPAKVKKAAPAKAKKATSSAKAAKKPTKKPKSATSATKFTTPSANGKTKKAAKPPKKPAKTGRSVTALMGDDLTGSLLTLGPGGLLDTAGPLDPATPFPGDGTLSTGGRTVLGVNSVPQFGFPLAGANVAAATDLTVTVNTNRGDLGYIVELHNTTAMMAMPIQKLVAKPAGSPFSTTFSGAGIVAGSAYSVRVFVNPADGLTPPNGDQIINVNAQ